VRSIPVAADEYDMYAPTVLALLKSGSSDQHLADYLTSVVQDRMALVCNPHADHDIASMLRELYAISC
jgi:hypothetical protein